MKKIIVAFDSTSFSESAIDFAVRLNKLSPILLTGVFLPQTILASVWSYAETIPTGYFIPGMEEETALEVRKHIESFENICKANGIDYRVHKDFQDFSIPELIRESRFADLAILGSNAFYQNALDKTPNPYIKEVLHEIECPVILVPDNMVFPSHNILAYDGTPNSVYAIKQFSYLFPELASNLTFLTFATRNNEDVPHKVSIEELAARHYSHLEIVRLDFDPKKYLNTWLTEEPASILVTGAYGRSGLSTMIKRSFIDNILTAHTVPVFIAHK